MSYYRQVGAVPKKRHTVFRGPTGDLYYEELVSHEGFSSKSSLLYHRNPPSELVAIESVGGVETGTRSERRFAPRHFRCHDLDESSDGLVLGRKLVLGNDDCRISYVATGQSSGLYRNIAGDELVFVEAGSGVLESQFGSLDFRPGDHVVVPRATTHRWVVEDGPLRALVIESVGHFSPPGRYLSSSGQHLEHSPYCERDLRAPESPLQREGENVEVIVRSADELCVATLKTHPFDVIGWDGCVYPYAFSIHDFEPITGRIHQPPPVHQTFVAPNMVVCAFVPRLFDYHPEAIPAPYHHTNVDTDEVLFYVEGEFMSRKGSGVGVGSITFHPAGHTHGPQPGSIEDSIGKSATEEYAVMVDVMRPLHLGPAAIETEDADYLQTWLS